MMLRAQFRAFGRLIATALLTTCAALLHVDAMTAQAPTTAVGQASTTQTATITFTTGGVLEGILVSTQGATTLDFQQVTPGGTCVIGNSYGPSGTESCTVEYTFSPKAPGTRFGGIAALDGSGNVLGTVFLTGTGTGPQLSFPLTSSTAASSFFTGSLGTAGGIAVDAIGNRYFVDTNLASVVKISYSGGVGSTSFLGGGFSSPSGLAIDGNGNVYVADTGNGAVKEILPSSIVSLGVAGTDFISPVGVAVDGNGNVFVADQGNGKVKEISASGTITTIASGFLNPTAIAVDVNGNIFVTDTAKVEEIVGGAGTPVPIGGSGFNTPTGVAVDYNGNVYVTDSGNKAVYEIPGGTGTVAVALGNGFKTPIGLAVDSTGSLYVIDTGLGTLSNLDTQSPPSLSFPSTAVGASSASESFTIANIGNDTLHVTLPGPNPVAPADFNIKNSSSCPVLTGGATSAGTLPAGGSCTYDVIFSPLSMGSLSESVELTVNSLNVSTPETIGVSGKALGVPTLSISNPASVTFGTTSVNITGTLAFPGTLPSTPVAISLTVGGGAAFAGSCDGPTSPLTCTATYDPSSLTVAGSKYTIDASYAGDSNYEGATATAQLTVIPATPTINIALTSAPATTTVDAPFTFTATVASTTGTAPTGAVTFYTSLNPATAIGCTVVATPPTYTCTTSALVVGTNAITATIAKDNNYNAATTATPVTENVTKAVTMLALASDHTGSPVVDTPITFTATLSGTYPFTTTPTGTVSFTSAGNPVVGSTGQPCTNVTLNQTSHTAICTTTALQVPADSIVATYSGDSEFLAPTSVTQLFQQVSQNTPTVSLASSLPTAAVNQPVTFSATITPSSASPYGVTPGGNVTFTYNSATICTAPVTKGASGTGIATCPAYSFSNVTGTVTTPNILASYSGDTNFSPVGTGGITGVTQTVVASPTSTTVTSGSPVVTTVGVGTFPTAAVNQQVVLTATLAPSYTGTAVPQKGAVTFTDSVGGAALCTSTVTSTSQPPFTCQTSFSTAGQHVITASFTSTDPNFASSTTQNSVTEYVTSASLSLSITSAALSATPLQVFGTATYTASFGTITGVKPVGSVEFYDTLPNATTGSPICSTPTVRVNSDGTIPTSCQETMYLGGTHSIYAVFTPDPSSSGFVQTTSGLFTVTVQPATTSLALTVPAPVSLDVPATLTATVTTPSAKAPTPTGNILFQTGSTTICVAPIPTGTYSATCAAPVTSAEPNGLPITATYQGDSNFTASPPASGTLTIPLATPKPTLISPLTGVKVNVPTPFTVQISDSNPSDNAASTIPSGSVTLQDSANPANISTPCTLFEGKATCTVALSTAGTDHLIVTYTGDGNFNPLTGIANTLTVQNVGQTNVTITPVLPPLAAVNTANPLSFQAMVGPGLYLGAAPLGNVSFKFVPLNLGQQAVAPTCSTPTSSITTNSDTNTWTTKCTFPLGDADEWSVTMTYSPTTGDPYTVPKLPSVTNFFVQGLNLVVTPPVQISSAPTKYGLVLAEGSSNTATSDPFNPLQVGYQFTQLSHYVNDALTYSCVVTPKPSIQKVATVPTCSVANQSLTGTIIVKSASSDTVGDYTATLGITDVVTGYTEQVPFDVLVTLRSSSVAFLQNIAGSSYTTPSFTVPGSLDVATLQCDPNDFIISQGASGYSPVSLSDAIKIGCSVTGSAGSYTVTMSVPALSKSASIGSQRRSSEAMAAMLGLPALLLLGMIPSARKGRKTLLRLLSVGLISVCALHIAGCGSQGFNNTGQQFGGAVAGTYLIGVVNGNNVVVAEIPVTIGD